MHCFLCYSVIGSPRGNRENEALSFTDALSTRLDVAFDTKVGFFFISTFLHNSVAYCL